MKLRPLLVATLCVSALEATSIATANSGHDGMSPKGRRKVPATHVLHERQNAHWETRWAKGGRVPARTLFPIRIGLMQSNLEVGARHLQTM